MGQTQTGKLTEQRVQEKLRSLGLKVQKPIPDNGIDLIVHLPENPRKIAKIQIKGRNPQKDPNLRWFQIRVSPVDLKLGKDLGISAKQCWCRWSR